MIIILTKKQLIAIIRREPLRAGSWLSVPSPKGYESIVGKQVKDCVGCAVGGVICSLIDPEIKITVYDPSKTLSAWIRLQADHANVGSLEMAHAKIREKKYLGALSHAFEYFAVKKEIVIRHHSHPVKKQLVQFITENFPESIEVDIDGFKPREKKTRKKKEVTPNV